MLFYSLNSEFELFEGDCIKELTGITRCFDMIFADPPYFLSGAGKTVKGKNIVPVYKGDWDTVRSDDEKDEFNYKWLSACREVLKDDGTIWIFVIRFEPSSGKLIRASNLKQKLNTYLAKVRPLSDFIDFI